MFADPQSVTINAVAQSLPAVSRGPTASEYRKDDATVLMTIGHQYKVDRNRFTIRLEQTKTAPDPLVASNNKVYGQTVYIVLDKPVVGYTNSEAQLLATALVTWCTPANLLKVLGGET